MDAKDALIEMRQNYQRISSYQDTGYLMHLSSVIEFSTYFLTPNKWRFEWSDTWPWEDEQGKIWRDEPARGKSVTWFDGQKTYEKRFYQERISLYDNLRFPIPVFEGPSSVFHPFAPSLWLLEREYLFQNLLKFENPFFVSETDEDYVIRASFVRKDDSELQIRKSDHLLRRFKQKDQYRFQTLLEIDDQLPDLENEPFTHDCVFEKILFGHLIDPALFPSLK